MYLARTLINITQPECDHDILRIAAHVSQSCLINKQQEFSSLREKSSSSSPIDNLEVLTLGKNVSGNANSG